MNNLPPELQCLIFTFALSSQYAPKPVLSSDTTPLTLGAVCSIWRNVVWSSPELWTSPTLELQHDGEKSTIQTKILEDWLSRASKLPLYIRLIAKLHSLQLIQVFRVIDNYSSQWRHLVLQVPTLAFLSFSTSLNLPLLQSVVILPSNGDSTHGQLIFRDTPQLQSIQMDCSLCHPHIITASWELLRHLKITSIAFIDCFSIILRTPRITHCHLENVRHRTSIHNPAQHAVLEVLNWLRLSGTGPAATSQIFRRITTPNATSFSFYSASPKFFPSGDLVGLIQRSGCTLTNLSFKGMVLGEQDLMDILPVVPSLVSFSLVLHTFQRRHLQNPRTLTDRMLSMLRDTVHPCLPRLETFTYAGTQSFSWDALLTTMEYRSPLAPAAVTGSVARLKSINVRIILSPGPTAQVDIDQVPNCFGRVPVLRAAGMNIDLTRGPLQTHMSSTSPYHRVQPT